MHLMREIRFVGASAVFFLLLVACTGSFDFSVGGQSVEEAAQGLIADELAPTVGLGELDSTCDTVVDAQVGSVFTCESTTAGGQVIEWEVTVDREDHIDVQSQNLLLDSALPGLEEEAAESLFGDNPRGVIIDCGDSTLIFDDSRAVTCVAFDGANPDDRYDTVITFQEESQTRFDVKIADGNPFFGFDTPGQSPGELALELIGTQLTESVDLGPLATTCDQDPSTEVGTEFTCLSETLDGETIVWTVLVDREDHIDVTSDNIMPANLLPRFEEVAVDTLYGDNPLDVAIDCGDETRVLQPDRTIICDATTPTEPDQTFDAVFTFTDDLNSGDFNIAVSDTPR